jgi:hypothetical protein
MDNELQLYGAGMQHADCVAGCETLLPAGQAGQGSRFDWYRLLTSKLALMSGKPTWGGFYV